MERELVRNALSDEKRNEHPEGEKVSQTDPIHMGHRSDSSPNSSATMASDEPQNLASEEAQRIVKICKKCMVSQQGKGAFCVKCGAELVPIRSVETSCIGDVVNEKYRIVEAIGSGGMGDVYLGVNEPLGQRVAIKFLNQKFTSDEKIVLRFLNEARSYCKVAHPNAVTLLEYGQHHDGSLYLITEYIDGKSLTDVIRAEGPLPLETIISIGVQVCEVLNAAHKQGVIHRDLKPDNLMLVEGFRGRYAVKVLDFGIAKIGDDDPHGGMTETGSVFGTPEFMSPEQARGESADSRADLYALGIILYFLATAKLPFRGKNKFAILNKQLNEAPRPPSQAREGVEVHPELEAIILKCLEKDREQRPQEAEEIADWLESIEIPRGVVKRPKPGPPISKSSASSSPGIVAGSNDDKASIHAYAAPEKVSGSTFDDDMASMSSFELSEDAPESIDPLGPTIGEEASGVTKDPRFQKDFDDEPFDSGEISYRVDSNLGSPVRTRSAMLAVLMTFAVVGAVIFFTGRDENERTNVDSTANESAPEIIANAHSYALLQGAASLVERGDFAAADQLLGPLDEGLESGEVREEFERLVRQASRARNEQMQVRAALNHRECERANEHLSTLTQLSPGAAAELLEAVETCDAAGEPGPARPVVTPPVVENRERVEPEPQPREDAGEGPEVAVEVAEGTSDAEEGGLVEPVEDSEPPEQEHQEAADEPATNTPDDSSTVEASTDETPTDEASEEEAGSEEDQGDEPLGLPPRRI